MNPFFNPMMRVMQQYQQVKQNPSQLASILQQQGMINAQQAKDISQMGGNYGQIGQYLINNGAMTQPPQNIGDQLSQQIPPC